MKKALAVAVLIGVLCGLFWLRSTGAKPLPGPVADNSGAPASQPPAGDPGTKSPPAGQNNGSSSEGQPAPAQTVHAILGRSNNLTAKQWKAMLDWRKYAVDFASSHKGVFVNGWPAGKEVCLTFDDGPDGVITPQVLDTLERYHVKASFFFMGNKLDDNRDVVKRAYADGDLVLSHTWDHPQLIKQTPDQIRDELTRTEDKLHDIIGVRPAIVRPPFGDIDEQSAKTLRDSGYAAILWSIDTLDWSQKEKANIVKNVLDNVRPGDIILMHSIPGHDATAKALPEIIAGLQAKGYRFSTLSEMLHIPAYK